MYKYSKQFVSSLTARILSTSRGPTTADDGNANANANAIAIDATLNLLTTPDIRRKRPRCDGHGNGNDNDNDGAGAGADASADANVNGESSSQDNISRNDSIHNPMLSAVSTSASAASDSASTSVALAVAVAVSASASTASTSTSRFHTPILVQSQGYGYESNSDEDEDGQILLNSNKRRKTNKGDSIGATGATTGTGTSMEEDDEHVPAALDTERFDILDGDNSNDESNSNTRNHVQEEASLLLELIPQDVIQTNICSYLTDAKDHNSLQLTCRKLLEVTNSPNSLSKVSLAGHSKDGRGGILNGVDLPDIAIEKLYKYAVVGNQEALYMIGMIAAYCHGDNIGVTILRQNANMGCLRSSYTLSLILRDCDRNESDGYLRRAVKVDYLPACQELLSSQEVKDKFGDINYKTLRSFFDPIALNRLLSRTYLQNSGVRGVSTSHCWNPNCGRWALKAQNNGTSGPQLQPSSKYLPPLPPHLEASLLKLVEDNNEKLCLGSDSGCGSGSGSDNDHNTPMTCIPVKSSMSSTLKVPRSIMDRSFRVSRMKMCSSCRRAKYCSKLCQVYDWRSGQHKMECQYL